MKTAKVFLKTLAFILWSIPLAFMQVIMLKLTQGPNAYAIPYLWQKGICAIFGLKVITEGTPLTNQQTLFVCNHVSYLDIPVLGSILKASFVAKKDVAGWPVFGFLSRLQQTAFISRARADAHRESNALATMLDQGKSLILFPEGTSTDGSYVAPFKSSLFSMTLDEERKAIAIQPVTLRLETADGKPVTDGQAVRDAYAWYGDMTMPPHLKTFAASRGATVRVIFHPPLDAAQFAERKELAETCWQAVQQGLASAMPCAPGLASDRAA